MGEGIAQNLVSVEKTYMTKYNSLLATGAMAIQKLCYTEYFKPLFKKVKNKDDLLKLKEEIEKYHQHTGNINEKDNFMIYIQNKMRKINKK